MKNITSAFLILFGLLLSFGQTVFAPSVDLSTLSGGTGAQPYAISSGLINNDAFIDVIFSTEGDGTIEWYENDGAGNFTFGGLIENGFNLSAIYGIKLVDLDGDTDLDVLASGNGSGNIVWYQNDGSGGFSSANVIDDTLSGPVPVEAGTVDAGTTVDIVVGDYNGDEIIWYSNDGSGNFTKSNILVDNTLDAPVSLQLFDFDGDSDLDVIASTASFGNIGGNRAELFINDLVPGGSVAFAKNSNPVATGLEYGFGAENFDLDGDSNVDILLSDLATQIGAGSFYWIEDNGSGFDETEIVTSIGNPADFAFVDMDGDALNDIVLSNGALSGINKIVWFKNNGDGTFAAEQAVADDQNIIYGITSADFDGDGDTDIVSIDYNTDTLWYVENLLESLSTPEFERSSLSIYPNPVEDRLYVSASDLTSASITITDLTGKIVFNDDLNLDQGLDVSNLSNGVYILSINQNSNYRFIKM